MIEISNLRTIHDNGWTKIAIDISVNALTGGGGFTI